MKLPLPMKLSLFTLLSFLAPVKSEANETVALGVDTYECDKEANYLDEDHKQIKVIGSVYRICMRPNQAVIDAGIQIKKLDNWEWSTNEEIVQKAVTNGEGIPFMNSFKCYQEGTLCIFDSTLTADFYQDPATVSGVGEVVLIDGEVEKKVAVKQDLFMVNFKVELSEELEQLVDRMKKAQNEAADEGTNEIAASVDTMSAEL